MQAAEHLQEILMGFQHFQTSTQKLAENDPKLSVLDIFFWRKMNYYHLKFFIVENMSEVGYLLKTSTLVSRPPKNGKKITGNCRFQIFLHVLVISRLKIK